MKYKAFYALSITLFLLFVNILCDAQERTAFRDAGKYGEFLDDLHRMMIESPLYWKRTTNKKERQEYVFWIRDHVHVMKALEYWEILSAEGIQMHRTLEQLSAAEVWDHYAEIIRLQTNQVCWNVKPKESNTEKIRDSHYIIVYYLKGNKHNIKLSWKKIELV
jgi:hypothetical protein